MKPSDFQKTVMCRFDSCLKKTVFGVVKDYYKELKKNQAEAICKFRFIGSPIPLATDQCFRS